MRSRIKWKCRICQCMQLAEAAAIVAPPSGICTRCIDQRACRIFGHESTADGLDPWCGRCGSWAS